MGSWSYRNGCYHLKYISKYRYDGKELFFLVFNHLVIFSTTTVWFLNKDLIDLSYFSTSVLIFFISSLLSI